MRGLRMLNNIKETNIYFNPGDVVQVKQDLDYKPKMIVIRKITSMFKNDSKRVEDKRSILRGIKCMWYTSDGVYQEALFNTKDLELVK